MKKYVDFMTNDIINGKNIFYIYFFISTISGLIVCVMNLNFSNSIRNETDLNPMVAFYIIEILKPMIIGFIVAIIVSFYQFARYVETSKLSLIPLIIWILSFIVLFI